MARTSVNVLADSACTVIVARLSGETDVLKPGGRPESSSPPY
jgi:Na+/H+-dicarboxylate symporter